MRKNSSGFSLLLVVILIFAVLLIVLIGSFFLEKSKNSALSRPDVTQTKTRSDTTPFTLKDKKLLFSGGYADPAVVKLPNGQYALYIFRFKEGTSRGTLIYISNDAVNWKEKTGIIFPGLAAVKPLITPAGIRMYHGWNPQVAPGTSNLKGSLVSSFSENGLTNWEYEGLRVKPLSGYEIIAGTPIKLTSGTYRMFFDEVEEGTSVPPNVPQGTIWGASSPDGLTWKRDQNPTITFEESVEGESRSGPGSIPQVLKPFVIYWSQKYWMFYNSHSKIFAAVSKDALSWKKLGYIGINGADVDAVVMPDQSLRIYFGDFDPQTSGVVYTGILEVK